MSDTQVLIPVARPWLGEEEADAARRVILSGWVTQGPEVASFEQEFSAFVGARHACAVSNCTVALYLALKAVGVRAGDEVVTVSHSYIATANSIRYFDARPVFVDIAPATFNIDPRLLEAAIGPSTRAILVVHQVGMPCDMATIVRVARQRRLPVIEDAACAVGSEVLWQGTWEKIGKPHGDIACFSFHPRKLLTTGDGGMLTTSNPEWNDKFRLWRQHSMSVSDAVRHSSNQVIRESYPEVGYNFRMTDIQAAVGREQLRRLPAMVSRRRQQVARYRELLRDVRTLQLPLAPEEARSNWQSLCVRLSPSLQQAAVMQQLLDMGISTRRGVMCAHREPAYPQGTWTCQPDTVACPCGARGCGRLLHSEQAQDQSIIVPLYHDMTDEQQDQVVEALKRVCHAL